MVWSTVSPPSPYPLLLGLFGSGFVQIGVEDEGPASAQSEVGERGESRCSGDSGSAGRRRRCGDKCSDAGAHAGVARGVRGKSDDESIAEQGYMGQRVRVEGGQRRGLKRRGAVVDGEEGWLTCVVGECRGGDGFVVLE